MRELREERSLKVSPRVIIAEVAVARLFVIV